MIRLKKDIKIQAIQFINTPERIEEIRKKYNEEEVRTIYRKDETVSLVLHIGKNLLYVKENEWIVQYPFVDLRGHECVTMSDEEFKEYFEII